MSKFLKYLHPLTFIAAGQAMIVLFLTVFSASFIASAAPDRVSLVAVGDIMLSRTVGKKMRLYKNYDYPFLKTGDYLRSADIVFGNLETAITPGREIHTGEFSFRSDPEVAQALADANFSVLSVANNHSPNFGAKGLNDTFRHLDEAGILYVGAGPNKEEANAPVFYEAGGHTFAFLGYTEPGLVPASYEANGTRPGTAFMNVSVMQKSVQQASQDADYVIVSMHSGVEYVNTPNDYQRRFARAAIDAGATLVIGHHPHVYQSIENYNGRYILYSLGNFIFDQMWSRATREGLVAKVSFDDTGVESIEILPVLIDDYSQPRFMTEAERRDFFRRSKLPEVL